MKKFEFIYFGQLLIASSDYIFLCLTFCLVKLPPTVSTGDGRSDSKSVRPVHCYDQLS